MSFLSDMSTGGYAERYAALGYKRNPFPTQGQVDGDVYVSRPELKELEDDLQAFLKGREHGHVWALQGAVGFGKSNFLRFVERRVTRAAEAGEIEHTACRFVASFWRSRRKGLLKNSSQRLAKNVSVKSLKGNRPLPRVTRDGFWPFLDLHLHYPTIGTRHS